ncbi:MAG: imidazole glycerol phosphate synthase subunit HisH, partial [Rhodospirillales bacterium]|nr:imidazole glycerol phosphate synthase subunit HisH [Rhodospirillales bacterium]
GLEAKIMVSGDATLLDEASHIVLPGVGAFADCLAGLNAVPGMREGLEINVRERGKPFLGICVGMQLMARMGLEHGKWPGLGWIDGEVVPLAPSDTGLKIPHMGWNNLDFSEGVHPVLEGIGPGTHAYFVHGYHFALENPDDGLAAIDYGGPVAALIGRDNLLGTQFHPEKSQKAGLRFLENFLRWRP